MIIRKFNKEDAIPVSEIIKDCFVTLDIGKHSHEGIRFQIEWNSPDNLIKRSKDINYFVTVIDEIIVGICGYDSLKVHSLFISPIYQNKGYGRSLLERILFEARNDGLKSIITWSTIYAEKFYKSFSFNVEKEICFPENKNDITLIQMRKDSH